MNISEYKVIMCNIHFHITHKLPQHAYANKLPEDNDTGACNEELFVLYV